MPLTPRLARIIAAMIDAKLDAEDRRALAAGVRMAGTDPSEPATAGRALGRRRRGRR